jgi:hypothetical protein
MRLIKYNVFGDTFQTYAPTQVDFKFYILINIRVCIECQYN